MPIQPGIFSADILRFLRCTTPTIPAVDLPSFAAPVSVSKSATLSIASTLLGHSPYVLISPIHTNHSLRPQTPKSSHLLLREPVLPDVSTRVGNAVLWSATNPSSRCLPRAKLLLPKIKSQALLQLVLAELPKKQAMSSRTPREDLSHLRHDLESHPQVVLRSTITAATRHSIRSHSPIRL